MNSRVFPARDLGPHDIPGLESPDPLRSRTPSGREPELVRPADLMFAPAHRLDGKEGLRAVQPNCLAGDPDARSVDPVGLGIASGRPVELGPSAGTAFHGETERLETIKESPAGGVDRRRVLERCLGLSLDL